MNRYRYEEKSKHHESGMKDEIKVVYVEDQPSIARLLSSGLGLFDIKVHPIFMSAEELLAEIDSDAVIMADILMFDIRLPNMTGVHLAKQLRKMGEKRPFVLISAWSPPTNDTLVAIQADFISKPFHFPDVVKTIQNLV